MKSIDLLIKAKDIEEMEGDERVHFLNSNAQRTRKSIGDKAGLSKIGVHIIYVEPGKDTTEYHKHYHEEECIYVLSGKGTLIIEGENFLFEKGDFVGFPADTAAHALKNTGTEMLVCLVMGQRLEQDVADYPNKNKRLYRNNSKWDLVDMKNILDPRNT
ncbi:MAG: cupin domain-containing protein [Gammaproteobacteria bacterium]|nr:cupin domain-containing protein [Gammaproteobacteria bacterium]